MIDQVKTMSPEAKLLISLCRLQFNDRQKEGISEIIQQVTDWNCFARMANEHGIIALVSYNIKVTGRGKEIPGKVMAILENGYMQSLIRNTWLTERWKEVNTILCNAGIKHILLKGMALEHTIYGARGLRQMNDNDILLKRDDALKAWHLLQQEGFSHELIKSDFHKKIMADTGKHMPTLYRNGYAIEIHHRLSGFKITDKQDIPDPFDNPDEILAGDTKAFILPREQNLKFLVDHFEKHLRSGNCQLRLYTDIMLLDETNAISVPESFISNPHQEDKPEYRKAAYKETIRSVPAEHRLLYIAGDIFPSVEWMRKRYNCPRLKAALYYPLRVGKLLWLI